MRPRKMAIVGARCLPTFLLLLALSACGTSGGVLATSVTPTITVPKADRFTPQVAVVVHGMTVTFHNEDKDAHTATTVPGAPAGFNLLLPPGATRTVTLATGGAYRFYCTIHASYDTSTGQVAAKPAADHPDEPMAGTLFVE